MILLQLISFTDLFNIKEKIDETDNNGTKNGEIMVPLKCLRNFWKTLEIRLINGEINLDLNWYKKCVIVATDTADQGAIFSITDAKLYVQVVTLWSQDNVKLLEQIKSGFKRTINLISISINV